MEYYRPPFESNPDPDETGSVEGGKKKKKKTTRIPKSAGILPKLEAEETKAAGSDAKDQPDTVFEKMFARETDKEEPETKEDKRPEGTLIPETTEVGEEVLPEQEFEALEEEPVDLPDSLEGEFAEEGVIIGRAEAPEASAKTETMSNAVEPEEAPVGPLESSLDEFEPPHPTHGSISFEALPPEGSITTETVPTEEVVPFEPLPRRLFNTANRFEPAIMNERQRAEYKEPSIPISEHEREVHYAKKRATTRGVWSGGIFGYWLGRKGRRAAEEEADMARETVRKQDKKIERLEAEQLMAAERFRNIQSTQAELINHTRNTEKSKAEAPSATANETSFADVPRAETNPAFNKAEKQPASAELAPEDRPLTEETYRAPAGRRVETSSWHRYEVDEKTGKVVENPELAYGEEFLSEQRQERLQRPATESQVAVQLGQTVVQNTGTNNSVQIAPISAPVSAESVTKEKSLVLFKKTYVKQQLIRRTTDPVTWVVALGLVVLLFVVGIL